MSIRERLNMNEMEMANEANMKIIIKSHKIQHIRYSHRNTDEKDGRPIENSRQPNTLTLNGMTCILRFLR